MIYFDFFNKIVLYGTKHYKIPSGQGLYMAHKYKMNLGNLEDGICVVELEHILMSCTLNYMDTDKLLRIKKKKFNLPYQFLPMLSFA